MSNVSRKWESGSTVRFTHQSAFNEIVGTSQVCLSHYFVAHWLPKITPNGLKILLQLRSMGYYNPKTEEKRGDIDIEQPELAKMIGVSVKTVQRTFVEDEVLSKYVQRMFQVKRDSFGRIVKEHYVYVVTMDDVLTPEDQARYQLLLEGPDKPSFPAEGPKRQIVSSEAVPKRHFDVSGRQNVLPKRHFVASTRQNVASYNKVILTLNTLNTSDTAALPGDSTSSLFEEKNPEKKGDILGQLSAAEFTALEAEARARVIAEIGEPIRTLARQGKAVSDVKRMMRKMLRESTGA